MLHKETFFKYYHSFGPGILLAGTAIGVSHIVQSVQAGATFGFLFIIAILIAHLSKYPFFQFAPRYSAATGKTVLFGYANEGKFILIIYLLLSLASLFTIQSAVTVVGSSVLANIIGINLDIKIWSVILLTICYLILLIGKYDLLDSAVKFIVFALAILTSLAVIIAFLKAGNITKIDTPKFDLSNHLHIAFLIGFLGWMPCPLDCSIWNSLWVVEKNHNHIKTIDYKKTILDFNVGYVVTAIIAIFFLSLGSFTIYGTGVTLSNQGVKFISQLFSLYTNMLGSWSFYIIAFAAFATMFSTVITVFDAFTRVLTKTTKLLKYGGTDHRTEEKRYYIAFLTFIYLGTICFIFSMLENMNSLIKIATTISFLTTPIFAYLNYRLVTNKNFPQAHKPGKAMITYSKICMIFLVSFAIWYLTKII